MRNFFLIAALLFSSTLCFAQNGLSETETLRRDRDFGSHRLATSDTDAKILDFTVIGGSLFYIDYQDHGKDTDIYLREMSLKGGQRQAASTVVPGCRPQYLDNAGPVLRFYELESRTLNSYDPAAGAVVRSQPSNYFAESRTFREGTTIGRVNLKGRLHEKVFTEDQIREMSERLPVDKFQAFLINRTRVSYELGKYEIVLLGSELEVKMPLLPLYKHEGIVDGVDSRSRADQGLYPQLVRMSPGRDIAAVFRKHMPGITLFTEDGSILNEIPSPGTGMTVPDDGPFPGLTILIQNDVLVADDHLLVADNARFEGDERTFVIWKVDFDGNVTAMYRSPYLVTRMAVADGYLYLLGLENQFSRYYYR